MDAQQAKTEQVDAVADRLVARAEQAVVKKYEQAGVHSGQTRPIQKDSEEAFRLENSAVERLIIAATEAMTEAKELQLRQVGSKRPRIDEFGAKERHAERKDQLSDPRKGDCVIQNQCPQMIAAIPVGAAARFWTTIEQFDTNVFTADTDALVPLPSLLKPSDALPSFRLDEQLCFQYHSREQSSAD